MAKILLVEDNEMSRYMLSRRLERRGYEVAIAVNGHMVLAAVQNELPDLILIDMGLPELDGWEVTCRLKANEATQGITVIALTAYVLSGDRERALAAGCDDYETKPVDFKRLPNKIHALLEQV